jgi:diadenosine tetraphosphate (Ap4A) HIT family hydrolase
VKVTAAAQPSPIAGISTPSGQTGAILVLGNWVPPLHTHAVPRYADDPAPGGPIGWRDMFSALPQDADVLARHAKLLRRALSA